MRILISVSLLFLAVLMVKPVCAQTSAEITDKFQFGIQQVRIPAPEGFFDVFPNYSRLKDRFISTQGSTISVIAVHVPVGVRAALDKDQDIQLQFYTRVSVDNQMRAKVLNPRQYKDFIAAFESQFDTNFDPNGPLLKATVKRAREGMNKHFGEELNLDIKDPKRLGFFQKESNVFSGMILMTLEIKGRSFPLLGAFSLVYVKNRMVYAHAYRLLKEESDPEFLREFAKKWTAAIIAANS